MVRLSFSHKIYKTSVIHDLDAVNQQGIAKPASRQIGSQGVKLEIAQAAADFFRRLAARKRAIDAVFDQQDGAALGREPQATVQHIAVQG